MPFSPIDAVKRALDETRKIAKNGSEYWMGRDIQSILGYARWDKFVHVINKAMMACESAGADTKNHFSQTGKMVEIGSGAEVERADFFLSRYACYLVAMNGDSSKPEIGTAQVYFAVQTRRQEVQDQLSSDEHRLRLRQRIRAANKSLSSVAKQSGVQHYAMFQAAGYQGLYEMGLVEIKRRKSIKPNEDLLDRAGKTELAANEFRITQTEDKLIRDRVNSERQAIMTHQSVGQEVRHTIKKLGGRMPEDLPAEPSIRLLEKKQRKAINESRRLNGQTS